ncbi:MAG: hypothetical protein COC10_09305 [Sphingobium sp.]|jgi:hypothetical protein|nr:MAG: hypothetical protein COC10_09305 [Sphingobium sp.]
MPSRREIHTRERAARALCRKDGHPENIMFEGRPMWQSYLDTVDTVIAALGDYAGPEIAMVPRLRLGSQGD